MKDDKEENRPDDVAAAVTVADEEAEGGVGKAGADADNLLINTLALGVVNDEPADVEDKADDGAAAAAAALPPLPVATATGAAAVVSNVARGMIDVNEFSENDS